MYTPATAGKMALQEVMCHLPKHMPHHGGREMTATWHKVAARLEKAVKVLLAVQLVLRYLYYGSTKLGKTVLPPE